MTSKQVFSKDYWIFCLTKYFFPLKLWKTYLYILIQKHAHLEKLKLLETWCTEIIQQKFARKFSQNIGILNNDLSICQRIKVGVEV